jgi:uncharacterized protein involved in copper resistance
LTSWLLLLGMLLQSVAWALPAQRAEQAERLSHEVAHALDHGHHQHPGMDDRRGHEVDEALLITGLADPGEHGPHHVHAAEGTQYQGLPVASPLPALALPAAAPPVSGEALPPSADPDSLLRPPQATA